MAQKTVVIDVVALTKELITTRHTPFIHSFAAASEAGITTIEPAFPALTCTAQTTYLTGKGAGDHGIAGNGWFDKTHCEIRNWHQSSKLVNEERLWTQLKRDHPDATVFVNGWWNGMHENDIDYFINVRPQYLQDGGKQPDVYAKPDSIRHSLQQEFGMFPMHRFWGPGANIEGSRWIANTSIAIDKLYDPTLTFVYLPHLDYSLQKYGAEDPRTLGDLAEIDGVVKQLVTHYESKGSRVILLSEYGIEPVSKPIYLNRVLRKAGLVAIRNENHGETIDYGESEAFALCDHQIAHVYLNPKTVQQIDVGMEKQSIKKLLLEVEGVEHVFEPSELNDFYNNVKYRGKSSSAHNPERTGDLVCVSARGCWFAYYYWFNDSQAPDYARCVAIHKKPGYDPAEMFFRFAAPFGFLWLLWKLLLIYLFRFRTSVDATGLDCSMIKGSHGRLPEDRYKPILISNAMRTPKRGATVAAEDVKDIILSHTSKKIL
eukprot:m.93120 g.93120  ORF g.93120 m.93120 type:complete len:487 (+) comp26607_c0_seq1:267-1727(+)